LVAGNAIRWFESPLSESAIDATSNIPEISLVDTVQSILPVQIAQGVLRYSMINHQEFRIYRSVERLVRKFFSPSSLVAIKVLRQDSNCSDRSKVLR